MRLECNDKTFHRQYFNDCAPSSRLRVPAQLRLQLHGMDWGRRGWPSAASSAGLRERDEVADGCWASVAVHRELARMQRKPGLNNRGLMETRPRISERAALYRNNHPNPLALGVRESLGAARLLNCPPMEARMPRAGGPDGTLLRGQWPPRVSALHR
jgi:hypothetical protein